MRYPDMVMDNGWRSRQRRKCQLAGFEVRNNSLCVCYRQKA